MPRPAKPPRLWLEERPGRAAVWCILDQGRITRTGCPHEDREGAERALADYLVGKHTPVVQGRQTSVADVLLIYAEHNAADPVPYHCRALAPFWHDKTLADVTAANCRTYVAGRPVKPSTARRELETLNAAIRFCAREKGTPVVLVTYPPKSPPKERFLTREEAAALLWAAWRSGNRHLARFILIGLYTGTRHDAILRLQWLPNTTGGWVNLEQGILHRRASGAKRTRKRQPPVRLSPKLLAHLRRWRRLDEGVTHVVSWADRPIKKERRAWASARDAAGLGKDVTPHTLRHTTVTWLLLAGRSTWDVASFVGMSEKTVREVYGHHSPHYQRETAEAL